LHFFGVKFIKKLANGLIDIHLNIPPNSDRFISFTHIRNKATIMENKKTC
jgi:hypothetical protein